MGVIILNIQKVLNENLIFTKLDFATNIDFFNFFEEQALTSNFIKKGYAKALNKRENEFPTGLQLEGRGVAIPHTDPDYILKEFIGVATFKEPIKFHSMEDPSQIVEVNTVFVLGLQTGNNQLAALQSVISTIQNNKILDQLNNAHNKEEVLEILKDS